MRVEQLSVGFLNAPTPALFPLNFSLKKGKTFALVGESGSGKTLTAQSILRILPKNARILSGKIYLNEENLLDLPEKKMQTLRGRKIAMIFQEPGNALNPVLSVETQLEEVLNAHFSLSKPEKRARMLGILKDVGIVDAEKRLKNYPFELSGGMKQRVMIAQALLGEPDFLIADEPTTALDVTVQAQILALLKKIQTQKETGILLITHDLGVVAQMADTVGVLYQGQLLEVSSKKDFFSRPQHPYSQSLMESAKGKKKRCFSAGNPEKILKIKQLTVEYPIYKGLFKRKTGAIYAVNDFHLDLKKGETLALVGESGSGKSSAGKAILRLIPFSGDIQTANNEKIQMIFQDPFGAFNPRWTVEEILLEGLKAQKKSAVRAELLKWLGFVGLPDVLSRYPHEFSGGQRQRIAIARALITQPQILILDEPTSALDLHVQAQILDLLENLQKQLALSFLLITHNFAVVRQMANSVAVLYLGHLVEWGTAESILNTPLHPYTQTLLYSIPKLTDEAPPDFILNHESPSSTQLPKGCPFQWRCAKIKPICQSLPPPIVEKEGHCVLCHNV